MKQKTMTRCLALLLAGVLLLGSPLPSFAAEQNQDLLKTSEDNVAVVNDEAAMDEEQKNDEAAMDEEQKNDEAATDGVQKNDGVSVDEEQKGVADDSEDSQDDQATREPGEDSAITETDDPVNKEEQEDLPKEDTTE